MNTFVLDLRECNVGMSCEEYTTIMIAGISSEIPQNVRDRMKQHWDACSYHRSSTFLQSAVGTPVTEEIEQGARDIIKEYTEKEEGE